MAARGGQRWIRWRLSTGTSVGTPYLHYRNHKMRRDAVVPIDTGLAAAIETQQRAVLAEHPAATCLLPRPTRNPDAQLPFSTATFRGELVAWLRACDIRDELGQPVHVTHTSGGTPSAPD